MKIDVGTKSLISILRHFITEMADFVLAINTITSNTLNFFEERQLINVLQKYCHLCRLALILNAI